jgi:Tol biopolymer transport system component
MDIESVEWKPPLTSSLLRQTLGLIMCGWTVKLIASLAAIATLIGAAQSIGAVEHGNVAFDISPDGKRIAFSAADGDLYLFHLESRRVDRLTSTKDTESMPAFSHHGRSVVFGTRRPRSDKSNLAVLEFDGMRVRNLTEVKDVSDSAPAFSRDGKRITFLRAHRRRRYSMGGYIWDDYDIYAMNANGSDPRRLTGMKYYLAYSPHFTSDGGSVVFAGKTTNYPASSTTLLLEVIADGTGTPHALGSGPKANGAREPDERGPSTSGSHPRISPDGKTVAFISDQARSYAYDIHVMKRDASATSSLGITGISQYNKMPVFLPDSKRLLFLAGTEHGSGNRAIYSLGQVDVDGKNARLIADSELFTNPQRWKPKP